MREKLEANGWVMYWQCGAPCFKQYFNHADFDDYEIRYKIKSKTFSIMFKNQVAAGPFWEYQLEQKLEEWHIKN